MAKGVRGLTTACLVRSQAPTAAGLFLLPSHLVVVDPGSGAACLARLSEWAEIITEELDIDKHTVVLCHHGVRSMYVASFLASRGFQQVSNVSGGIDAYSLRVDPSLPRY